MIPRRALLAAGPLALAACGKAEQTYFGRTEPPHTQRLVYLLDAEIATLDPALSAERSESHVIYALFEGLTTLHPIAGTAMAALATHYKVTPDGHRYTFFLRGHAEPRGTRLPDTAQLPREFSRGREAPADGTPARWSDGRTITAHDFVYAWRRAADPTTASPNAVLMSYVAGGAEIGAGKRRPDLLGVRAIDDFTLDVELGAPAPFFLELASHKVFCPVPRHIVEAAGKSWTLPGPMVSSGAFVLRERRPYDRVVLSRNPHYFDAGQVLLDELAFLVVSDATARLNLYKVGDGVVTQPWVPTIMPALRGKKDFNPLRAYSIGFLAINTATPPFDDVRVRYALNMATDKRPLAEFLGAGSIPAVSLTPRTPGYESPLTLPVPIDGTVCDVLSFHPQSAREIFAKSAGAGTARIEYLCPSVPDSRLVAQVLQQQWRAHLGVNVVLTMQELQTWIQTVTTRAHRGVAEYGSSGGYVDPTWFLDPFTLSDNVSGWVDPEYNTLLAEAKSTVDPPARLAKLAECERRLLRGMPVLPLTHEVWPLLRKPFVKGLGSNVLDRQQYKYAWIDTSWRPQ